MPTAEPAPKPKKTWVISGTLFQKEFGKRPSKTFWKGKAYEGPAFKAFIEGKRGIPTAPRSLADRILGRGREPGTVKLGHEITQLEVGGAFRSRAPFKIYKELDTRIGPFANEVKVMDAIDKFMGSGGDESRRDKQTGEPLNKRQIVMHNMLSAAGVEDADAIVSKIKFETGQDSTVWTSEKFVNKLLDIRRKHYRGWVPLGRLMYEHRGEIGKTINEVVNDAIGDGTLHIDRYPSGGPSDGEGRGRVTPRPRAPGQRPQEGRHDALERLMERQGKRAGDLSGFFERMDAEGLPRRIRPVVPQPKVVPEGRKLLTGEILVERKLLEPGRTLIAPPEEREEKWVDRRRKTIPREEFFKSRWYSHPMLVSDYNRFIKAGGTQEQWDRRMERYFSGGVKLRKVRKGQKTLYEVPSGIQKEPIGTRLDRLRAFRMKTTVKPRRADEEAELFVRRVGSEAPINPLKVGGKRLTPLKIDSEAYRKLRKKRI